MGLRSCRGLLVAMCAFGVVLVACAAAQAGTTVIALRYGNPGDIPVTGDWNGSGKTQIGVYRPSDETFYLGDVNGVSEWSYHYGNPGDDPITGDWDGSGATQIGVYRPSDETFYLGDVNGLSTADYPFGNQNDVPITGDWDGSGRTQIGVYRPSDETFYLGDVNGFAPTVETFGDSGDIPITGDWNGSGRTQIGVYRPSTATFYLQETTVSPPAPLVVTAPVTTPLPAPAPGPPGHRRVSVRLTISWTWNRSRTRLHRLRLGRLPGDATLAVSCRGRGCPLRHARATGRRRLRGLVSRLDGDLFRAGDRILITVSVPGRVSERGAVRIRYGRLPLAREL
jgi:hypothetical protein